MLDLLSAASSVLGSSLGGGATPADAGPQTSQATATTTVHQATGSMEVGSSSQTWLYLALAAGAALLLWRRKR